VERILLAEDKASLREMLREVLEKNGYEVDACDSGTAALRRLESGSYTCLISDYKLPGADGMEVLKAALARDSGAHVILMTAYGTVELAVAAMKLGARDFLLKPVDPDHLLLVVDRALAQQRLLRENLLLKAERDERVGLPTIIGQSPLMLSVSEQVRKVAPTDATVLLLGESGTGKELFARAVHALSRRSGGPFVAINCAAIPSTLIENELFGHEKGSYTGAVGLQRGKFELADGGTIFLDEVGELEREVQGKILRALQERTIERIGGTRAFKVDVRIIAASNQDLKVATSAGRFRDDLFFRLNIFPVTIPPLRFRSGDIPLLVGHFLEKFGRELKRKDLRITDAAMAKLLDYTWPGNVRELENTLERAAILARGSEIGAEEIVLFSGGEPPHALTDVLDLSGTLPEALDRVRREVEILKIRSALVETKGNLPEAAARLGLTAKTLAAKMEECGISAGSCSEYRL
jgi:DNA-binding NtrC family response regulator